MACRAHRLPAARHRACRGRSGRAVGGSKPPRSSRRCSGCQRSSGRPPPGPVAGGLEQGGHGQAGGGHGQLGLPIRGRKSSTGASGHGRPTRTTGHRIHRTMTSCSRSGSGSRTDRGYVSIDQRVRSRWIFGLCLDLRKNLPSVQQPFFVVNRNSNSAAALRRLESFIAF